MFRPNDIQDRLLHVVGWQQNYNIAEYKIADSLTQTESGFYFQQVHPLITLDNLRSIAPNFDNVKFEEYSASKTYNVGYLVLYNGVLYSAKKVSVNKVPVDEPDYWEKADLFSNWLEQKTKASIQKAIARYCSEKAINASYKSLCENRVLFQNTGRIADTVDNKNKLVGFEIIPIRSKGVTTKINKIGLQFTEPGLYTLYIMQSGAEEPYKVIELEKQKANTMEWFTIADLYLPYQTANTDAGGSWFICYNQEALPVGSKAIRKNRDWSKGPCAGCSRLEYEAWQAWSRYLEIHPFRISNDFIEYSEDPIFESGVPAMWDIAKNEYTYHTNYGINLDVSVECDITDFIIEQRAMFQDVIAKQVAADFMREMAYNANVRTNRNSINASRTDILLALDGDNASLRESGLSVELDRAYKAIDVSTKGIDRVCLPCGNHGIKYRVV